MKTITILTPTYNEENNVKQLYEEVKKIFNNLKNYKYEHLFIDNNSSDNTVKILKEIAKNDKNVKIIVNSRNFGHIRSPFYGLLQTNSDAVMILAADFQDPPELIPEFIKKWEEGYKIVVGVKNKSKENILMFMLRKIYYNLIKKLSEDVEQIKNFTGFGLYDRQIIEILKKLNEPYPYLRGIISEIGFERAEIYYTQNKRREGKSKNNFYTLYDMAMTGIVNYSKIPLRISIFIGFFVAILSLLVALIYFVYKLILWNQFQLGMAPLVIGLFFFSSVQLIFIGILGEYIGAIYTQVKNRPLVIEKERVNFEDSHNK